ncbi:hypothetical protein [Frankia nepalensis]|uniref:hypothetical protein n=1 Tax=Frankia nepalensis TaxID=1836974 RepID=UPI001D67A9E9|nr:hypothetical protein [Frankia nepalensis]MBL7509507.1 hypothetical protein [Frankia nepalensis]
MTRPLKNRRAPTGPACPAGARRAPTAAGHGLAGDKSVGDEPLGGAGHRAGPRSPRWR